MDYLKLRDKGQDNSYIAYLYVPLWQDGLANSTDDINFVAEVTTWYWSILAMYNWLFTVKFLDAGIKDVSASISIVNDKTEMSAEDDGDESDKHI